MKNTMKWFGMALALAVAGCAEKSGVTEENPEPKVNSTNGTVTFATNASQLESIVVEAVRPPTNSALHVTGRLYWDDDVTVRIFTPVAGRVTAIKAKVGQTLAAGAPLAEIDSPDFGQTLASARTAVGNLAAADKTYARSRELFEHGAAAQKDVDAAQAAYVAAQAERDRAESVLANYGGSDTSTNSVYILRSPLAGMLVEKNITAGQELRADSMLANAPNLFAPNFVVSDPTTLWVQLDVAESDISTLRPGDALRLTSHAFPGKVFTGEVETMGDSLDPSSRTLKARGVVNNQDKLLKAEMYVTVELARDPAKNSPAGVEVPAPAVFLKGEKHFVFVQEQAGNFTRQEVSIGGETEGRVLVLSGLSPGQRVVTEGCIFLQQLFE